jgi:hypothetical protein
MHCWLIRFCGINNRIIIEWNERAVAGSSHRLLSNYLSICLEELRKIICQDAWLHIELITWDLLNVEWVILTTTFQNVTQHFAEVMLTVKLQCNINNIQTAVNWLWSPFSPFLLSISIKYIAGPSGRMVWGVDLRHLDAETVGFSPP